jgi:hypothetical protein
MVLPPANACEVGAAASAKTDAKTERITDRPDASLECFQREKWNIRCLLT